MKVNIPFFWTSTLAVLFPLSLHAFRPSLEKPESEILYRQAAEMVGDKDRLLFRLHLPMYRDQETELLQQSYIMKDVRIAKVSEMAASLFEGAKGDSRYCLTQERIQWLSQLMRHVAQQELIKRKEWKEEYKNQWTDAQIDAEIKEIFEETQRQIEKLKTLMNEWDVSLK